jgi:predicted SnoaL-like aldol condensation-catalyzing enzyme
VAHWLDAEPVRGSAAFREFHRVLSSSFRDIHVEVVREIQVGDLVAFQAEVRLVPVGQETPVTFNGGAFARVQGRQIVETWDSWNFLGLLEGMGALPQGTLRLALAGQLKVARGMA